MWVLVLMLAALGLVAMVAQLLGSHKAKTETDAVQRAPRPQGCDAGCTAAAEGQCAAQCLLQELATPAEYFEDEELDAYRGRAADSYTQAEVATFREVLRTLRPAEAKPWLQSLAKRHVALPASLRGEARALMSEAQSHKTDAAS